MLEPRPINDDVFLEERKKTNQYKNKKNLCKQFIETRLLQVSCVILNFLSLETIL